ncbi:hypothetical protein [Enterococcus sp. BWR-S5]|uniref:hypothetical protein n=1 Tax=Enterococcus sp. BWR-S5 TaxID=2787714 RepID=UPI0019206C25|nr:hypothetical protein [Enterococcus sp. BWR-S5]MBL1225702.1 hypothetical protein [Enterococcus sp. BWR-S5]
MKIKAIRYPTTLDKIEDITNDNIDVFVELEDGFTYVLVIATIKNIKEMMEDGYLEEGPPFIIVDELREDTIRKAIEAHAKEDAYYLKMNFLYMEFTSDELQIKIDEIRKVNEEIENSSSENK